jgi:hypothetical protein
MMHAVYILAENKYKRKKEVKMQIIPRESGASHLPHKMN